MGRPRFSLGDLPIWRVRASSDTNRNVMARSFLWGMDQFLRTNNEVGLRFVWRVFLALRDMHMSKVLLLSRVGCLELG